MDGMICDVRDTRSEEQLAPLRRGLIQGINSIVYGKTSGPELSDMHPFADTATRFLKEVTFGFALSCRV